MGGLRRVLRFVTDGSVACPLRDAARLEECLDCHLLEDVEGDRDGMADCASAPGQQAGREAGSALWRSELCIELL